MESDDKNKILEVETYLLTSLGRQLLKLGSFKPSEQYLLSLGSSIKRKGFKVSLIDYQNEDHDRVRCFNNKEIE